MHELALAEAVVGMAVETARGQRVHKIVVEVGCLAAVLPDALRFCFSLAAENTDAAGAELDIRELPARARCRGCQTEHAFVRPYGDCTCGGTDFEWLSGHELLVKSMEVG